MLSRISMVLIAAVIGMLVISCSGSGNPITGPPPEFQNPSIQTLDGSGASTHYLWGYWSVTLNAESMTAEITPLRGVEFTANVVRFMQPPISPTNMISISLLPGSQPLDGYFEVDVTLRHPFPGLPIYRGFDVRGILIANGSAATQHDTSASYSIAGDTLLLNADGLTRWWNAVEFTSFGTIFGYTPGKLAPKVYPDATLNPYKYFADSLGHDDPVWTLDPASRGTFPTTPGIYTRPYYIQFAMNGSKVDFTFNYAVDASWDLPSPDGAPNYGIDYYSLSANMVEPYCLSVMDNGSTAYYFDDTDKGGELNLAIRIYDWQSVDNPNGVAGELSAIWLESPVLASPVDVLPSATVLPDGPTSSVFEVSLGSLNLTKFGDEPLIIFAQVAEDFGYQPQVNGGNNFNYPDNPLGSYLISSVNIKHESGGQPAPIVLSIDPDNGVSGEVLTGVLVTGQYLQNGAQVELRRSGYASIKATSEVMGGGGTTITCDIDLDLAAEGDWDVAVINPDLQEDTLEGAFHVSCASEVHSYEGSHLITGGLQWNYCQRGDVAILETGPYAGQAVVKRNYISDSAYTGNYVRFDPDNPVDTPATDFFSLPGRVDSQTLYVTMTTQIEQNPVNGHMAVINGRMFDYVQFLNQQGVYLENIKVDSVPETYPGKYPCIPSIDFDADGDLWMIVDLRGEWPGNPTPIQNPIWQMRHYELQSSSPFYVENLADRLNITEDLKDPSAAPYDVMRFIADIAVSYTEDVMIVFAAAVLGSGHTFFVKYDLSTSPPTWVDDADLIPYSIHCSNPFSGITRADIDIDHTDLTVENCRVLIMYQTWSGSAVNVHLMRIDTDMNILNDQLLAGGFGVWANPHAFAINNDPGNRNLIAIDMANSSEGPLNDFSYFPMPLEGW